MLMHRKCSVKHSTCHSYGYQQATQGCRASSCAACHSTATAHAWIKRHDLHPTTHGRKRSPSPWVATKHRLPEDLCHDGIGSPHQRFSPTPITCKTAMLCSMAKTMQTTYNSTKHAHCASVEPVPVNELQPTHNNITCV